MRVINFKKFFLYSEAIRLKHAKKHNLRRDGSGAYGSKLNELFGDKDRLILDIDIDKNSLTLEDYPIIHDINNILSQHYNNIRISSVKEYVSGVVYRDNDESRKQPMRIGRLLQKHSTDEKISKLLNVFKTDPLRLTKPTEYKVVISRHPYDIAGASTDRNWTSCMRLGFKGVNYADQKSDVGINAHYIPKDIEHGSIIAYLVRDDDRLPNGKMAIKRPLARILMKPHDERGGNAVAYSIGRTYGADVSEFRAFIKKWLVEKINIDTKDKKMHLRSGLYTDNDEAVNFDKVKYSDSIAHELFYNLLSNKNSEKYFGFFDLEAEEGYYEGYTMKIQITFNIPKSIELVDQDYNRGERMPNYVNKIVDSILSPNYHTWGMRGEMLNFTISSEDHQLIVEYQFNSGTVELGYEDEKGNRQAPDNDEIHDFWDDFMASTGIGDFDYEKTLQKVVEQLKDHKSVHDSEYQEDLKKCQHMIESHLQSPRFLEKMREYKQVCEQALPAFEFFSLFTPTTPLPEFYKLLADDNFPNYHRSVFDWKRHRQRLWNGWIATLQTERYGTIDTTNIVKDELRKVFEKYDSELMDIMEKMKHGSIGRFYTTTDSIKNDKNMTDYYKDMLLLRLRDYWEIS